ncbi:MAG: hypothetical protein AAF171_20065 [Cyanobacteria bacterium P01_A01_bin.116]
MTGVAPQQAAVDKGFRGSKHHSGGLQALVAGTRKFKRVLKRLVKRRSAIEPVIGHLKHDHALKRNFLKGKQGDRINALLAAYGLTFVSSIAVLPMNHVISRCTVCDRLLLE